MILNVNENWPRHVKRVDESGFLNWNGTQKQQHLNASAYSLNLQLFKVRYCLVFFLWYLNQFNMPVTITHAEQYYWLKNLSWALLIGRNDLSPTEDDMFTFPVLAGHVWRARKITPAGYYSSLNNAPLYMSLLSKVCLDPRRPCGDFSFPRLWLKRWETRKQGGLLLSGLS